MTRTPGRNAILFIFLTVLIEMIGFGIIIPVMPKLLTSITGDSLSDAARDGGYLTVAFAVMQFAFAPIMGGLSDRFGRRPVLLFSLAGYSIDFLIMAVAPSYVWLFLGRMVSGVFAATHSTASAYIADVSPPEKRAGNFGLLGAAFGLGFIIGPAIGGFLGEIGPRAPFFAASALAAVNTVYGFFVLPETLAPENRRPFDIRRANPLGSLLEIRVRPTVLYLLGALFLMQLAQAVYPATWSYYSIARHGWSEAQIGISLAYVGLMSAFVQGVLAPRVIPAIGEARAAGFSLAVIVLAFLGYGFATEGWMVYVLITFGALAGFGMPAIQGIMSNATPANAQGELQGAASSVMSISLIAGPLAMTQTFAAFTGPEAPVYFPGAAFLLASALAATAVVPISLALQRRPAAVT